MTTNIVRKAEFNDLLALAEIFRQARKFMAMHGNPKQWGSTHPPMSLIERNIKEGSGFVCCTADGKVVGFFSLFDTEETYEVIREGHWLNEEPYLVMHSVAALPGLGAGSTMINHVKTLTDNIRIDTKEENIPMRSLLEKLGFVYCGIIDLKAGRGERVAYQWRRGRGA